MPAGKFVNWLPSPRKYAARTLPVVLTLPAVMLPVETLPPVTIPAALITPLVKTLPPVKLPVVVTGPVKLGKLPVYVGK